MTLTHDDIVDPRVVPRWVEAGVSGVPRAAEWEYVTIVDIPELAGTTDPEMSFSVLPDGSVVGSGAECDAVVLERLAGSLGERLVAPFDAVAVRQGALRWALAGRRVNLEQIELPGGTGADEIMVAIGPDGSRTVVVDGQERDAFEGSLAEAVDALERFGRARHREFVARAANVAGRWELTVDPL